MDFDVVQPCSHIVRSIILKLLKVGVFLDGFTVTVDVVVFLDSSRDKTSRPIIDFCRSRQPPNFRCRMYA